MRLKLSLAVLGILMSAGVPAQAQQTGQPTGYNAGYQYQPQQFVPSAPVYNNSTNAQPYYMNQQNAGYYNNNTAAPFNFNNSYNNSPSVGGLSPEQAAQIRAQREAAALAYQQQYFSNTQQPPGATANQVGIFNQTNPFYPGQQQQKPPTKRKVVYNEKNNPLSIPPRLFNPDQ